MRVLILLFIAALLFVGCGRIEQSRKVDVGRRYQPISATTTVKTTANLPISRQFIDPQVLRSTGQLPPFVFSGRPVAGIVNHHVLAADLIARFFKTLKTVRPNIQTFVILSPDHFSQGRGLSTSRLSYVTLSGLVTSDSSLATALGVWDGTEARAFENEHGVGALVPFVAREFPQAKIVPIFLRADVKPRQAEKLGQALALSADNSTFLIVSSDMSHFLNEKDARAHDVQTIGWLQQNQWDKLESATDQNTDSAVGLAILHSYLKQKAPLSRGDQGGFSLLSHKLSTDYGADPNNVTSYIVGFWR